MDKVKEIGMRFNEGKPMMSLLPPYALEEVAKVLTYGSQKYAKWNWMHGLPFTEILDSCERHISAWKKGEDIDESGCLHIAHAACNLLMLLELAKLRPDLDDRPLEFYIEFHKS
jgi:hypothetical protein